MAEHDADKIAADHALIEVLRGGGLPPDPDQVTRALAAWWRTVHAEPLPSMEPIYEAITGERLFVPRQVDSVVGREPATTMLPSPYPPTFSPVPPAPSGFEHDDGSVYARSHPDDFPSYDDVDSTTVDDPGAPA